MVEPPFWEFVLKVHERCNLSCDYCYMYELADQTWRDRPMTMGPRVWDAVIQRIAEHAKSHALPRVRVVLHGGEPLLLGGVRLAGMADSLRAALGSAIRCDVTLQTNGVLLDAALLQRLADARISIGVSLDGTEADHDRHRRRPNGAPTYAETAAALRLLQQPRFRPWYAGLLCTIDAAADPADTLDGLLRFAPPAIDLLLPHANWQAPPPWPVDAYGRWLIAAFDRWYDGNPGTSVRLFDSAIRLLLGRPSRSEQLGLSPYAAVVIETDGAIEQVDALKSAYHGAGATGLNVLADPLDAALSHPGIRARRLGVEALSPTCRSCPIHRVCGGGHYAHRYDPRTGFDGPSVYCAALSAFITHVAGRIEHDLRLS